jgi:hypothetical protein
MRPTWDSCSGSRVEEYFASASCIGQGTEATFPYDANDSNICNTAGKYGAERAMMQRTLNLHWAYVPYGSNTDLMRAVTYGPTQVLVQADGKAWQYYKSGVVPCSTEGHKLYVNRKYCHHVCRVVLLQRILSKAVLMG